jgi:hypothetical protein
MKNILKLNFGGAANKKTAGAEKTFKNTHKLKNTYVVRVNNVLIDYSVFDMCQTVPMALRRNNGEVFNDGWLPAHQFPIEIARDVVSMSKSKPNDEMSATVIEYMDKHNRKPFVYLGPQIVCFINDIPDGVEMGADLRDYVRQHMNRSTFLDFIYQMKLRGAEI